MSEQEQIKALEGRVKQLENVVFAISTGQCIGCDADGRLIAIPEDRQPARPHNQWWIPYTGRGY
jgi:hypothetical protein